MNISYNWLKEYVDFDLTAQAVAEALTSEGLEVSCVEEVQPIKGGLQGLVIGEVLTCVEHPNSDHMHVCTVNLGDGEPVQIVCGGAVIYVAHNGYGNNGKVLVLMDAVNQKDWGITIQKNV